MIRQTFAEAREFGLPTRVVLTLLAFQFGGAAMELVGLAALVPVFQYVQSEGDVAHLIREHGWWRGLETIHAGVGLSVTLASLLAISMISLLVRQGFVYARLVYQARAREAAMARARAEGFARYLSADLAYQDRDDSGRIVNDLTTDLTRAVENVFSGVALMGYGVLAATYVVALFVLSGAMTLLAVAIFGVALLALHGQLRKSERVGRQIVEANQAMSSFLVERLKAARLVRLAGTDAVESERMRGLTERQRDRNVRIFKLLANLEIIVEPLVIGGALMFVFVSIEVLGLRLEAVGLFLVLVIRLMPVMKEAARVRQSRRGTRGSLEAVMGRFEEMAAAREVDTGGRPFTGLRDGLAFSGVVFDYGNGGNRTAGAAASGRAALSGVDAVFGAREITALVGPSGAGKSTLVDMIPRLRRPQAGTIRADGVDIAEFSLASLRAGIAYAPQTPQIFNVPLAEHIRYGKPGATMDEVRRAARLANAAGFIEPLTEGYDTLAGDAGGRLSGGQRQRLDLARALVRGAPILLLDEPTSALDAESEVLFREALMRIRRETETTVIVIAHRLSTVSIADKIVVLDAGRVVAEGTHAALLAAGGWYKDAFEAQQGTAPHAVATG